MPTEPSQGAALPAPVPAPRWLLAPLARAYGLAVQRRNARFDRGVRSAMSAAVPVISVGSITAGGAGKTPMTQWIARVVLDAGAAPAIALRGYRASRDGASDEATEHAETIPDAPVAVGADRLATLRRLRDAGTPFDCAILDDGFQRRDVHRDLDIALVDATRDVFTDALLPLGLLREPVVNLRRAGAVILTRADLVKPEARQRLAERLRALAPNAIHAVARHAWTSVRVWRHGAERTCDTPWLTGRRVIACCAIARPAAFLAQLRRAGAEVADAITLRDHADFSPRVMRRLAQAARSARADAIVCTHKDWVKMRRSPMTSSLGAPIVWPVLSIEFLEGEDAIRAAIVAAIRQGADHASPPRAPEPRRLRPPAAHAPIR